MTAHVCLGIWGRPTVVCRDAKMGGPCYKYLYFSKMIVGYKSINFAKDQLVFHSICAKTINFLFGLLNHPSSWGLSDMPFAVMLKCGFVGSDSAGKHMRLHIVHVRRWARLQKIIVCEKSINLAKDQLVFNSIFANQSINFLDRKSVV